MFPRTRGRTRRGSSAICARSFRRKRDVPDRSDGEDRLGHADPDQLVARRDHRDPARQLAIVGVLTVALPAAGCAVSVLQVNFVGRARVRQAAPLFLRVAVRLAHPVHHARRRDGRCCSPTATTPNFVLSVGGFHPQFTPPPLPFPTPQRIALNLLELVGRTHERPAATSPSRRTRAVRRALGVSSSASAVRVQGHVGFDALFQFSPFHFIVESPHRSRSRCSARACFCVKVRRHAGRTDAVARPGTRLDFVPVLEHRRRLHEDMGRSAQCRCRRSRSSRLVLNRTGKAGGWSARCRRVSCSCRCAPNPGTRHHRAASARSAADLPAFDPARRQDGPRRQPASPRT